ncbi:MAG: hypothetical protein HW380_3299 [Magnetococcales bacterium]|nr:hypothetical protein [Magnetococcales bacterium]
MFLVAVWLLAGCSCAEKNNRDCVLLKSLCTYLNDLYRREGIDEMTIELDFAAETGPFAYNERRSIVLKKPGRSLLSRSASVLVGISLVASSLSGCAGVNKGVEAVGVSTQEGRIGSDDSSDPCYAELKTLDALGDFYGEDMLKGALIGAAAGAGIGFLTGQKASNVLAGAAIGAAVGAAGGYWNNQLQKGRAQAKVAAMADMEKELAKYDETQVAVEKLSTCRNNSLEKIKQDRIAKRTTPEMAHKQLESFKLLRQKDVALWQTIKEQSGKRVGEYKMAAAEFDRAEAAGEPDVAPSTQSNSGGGVMDAMSGAGGGVGGLAAGLLGALASTPAPAAPPPPPAKKVKTSQGSNKSDISAAAENLEKHGMVKKGDAAYGTVAKKTEEIESNIEKWGNRAPQFYRFSQINGGAAARYFL